MQAYRRSIVEILDTHTTQTSERCGMDGQSTEENSIKRHFMVLVPKELVKLMNT